MKPETPFERLMLAWLVLTGLAALAHWFFIGRKLSFQEEDSLGTVQNLEVTVAIDERRRRMVGLNIYSREDATVHAFLTPAEARLLAGWLRLAATPGRTLAEARRRMQRNPAWTSIPPTPPSS
jgi:hypothetical protein